MGRGTARSEGSSGENIQHFSHVRFRVVGSGLLRTTLGTLDDARTKVNTPFNMDAGNGIEPTILTNFVTQRASLKFEVTGINEWFRINRTIIFIKDFGSEYPM